MSEWVKCSERMPEELVDVLATDGKVVELMWLGDSGRWYAALPGSVTSGEDVTHWMPLPEPPEV